MPDVIPTIPLEPVQGIQALLDVIYLYNPDVANNIINVANQVIAEWAKMPKGGVRPYSELETPIAQYTAMTYSNGVYVSTEYMQELTPTPDMNKWVLVATIMTQEQVDAAVGAEATLRAQADTALSGRISDEAATRTREVGELSGRITDEATIRGNADNNLQTQIDAISASSDVTDIVGTYAELQQYDTSKLSDNDIIKVLRDETQNNATSYYRWVVTGGTGSFVLIGTEGPYYTMAQTDALVATKSAVIFRDWSEAQGE